MTTIALTFSIGCGAAGLGLLGGGTRSKPQNPTANAGGPYSANANQPVSFDGSKSSGSSGETLTYSWYFGDGGTGDGVKTTHAYTTPGTYTATLSLASSGGGTATATAAVTVNAVAVANPGGPYSGNAGQPIIFDGSKSTAPSGQTLTAYAWDFGDGNTGSGVSPTHAYAAAGTFTATLTVTASDGTTGTATATVTVSPNALANAGGPYSGNVGQAIAFDGSKSAAPAGQGLTYAWDFGDGNTGTSAKPTHTYTNAANYTATLTVNASGGSSSKATAPVTISGIATANAGGPYNSSAGQSITFDGSKSTPPSGQTLTYAWDFGDNSNGTGVAPAHTYTMGGSYTATLTVTASGGTSATASAAVVVTAAGTSSANAGGPYSGTVGQDIVFDGSHTSNPSGQTLTYSWDFGDGSQATGVAPSHHYAASGTYTVTLVVTWSTGGTSTSQTKATILDAAPTGSTAFSAHIVNYSDDISGETWITFGLLNSAVVPLNNVQVTSAQLASTALASALPIVLGDIGAAQEAILSVSVPTGTYLASGGAKIELRGSYSQQGQDLTFDFTATLDADPGTQGQSRWATTSDFPGGPPLRASMEGPLLAGFLPPIESAGSATGDELAAELALKVSSGGQDAVGALMQALLTAGFQIRGPNGTFDTSIIGDANPRQGLAIDGWEIASLSRQYADQYSVGVHTLGKAVATALPQIGSADLSPTLISDIQKAAVATDPDLRFLARFIVELGRKGDSHYDLLSKTLDVTQVQFDAIQNFLILVRLAGDIAQQSTSQSNVAPTRYLRPLESSADSPCSAGELGDTVIGVGTDGLKTMFRGVIDELIKGGTATFTQYSTTIFAIGKFLANYAFISADLSMDGDFLQRRKDTQPGERRELIIALHNDIGKFQIANCGKMFFTMFGLDPSVFSGEQINDVDVLWNLTDLPPPVFKGFAGYPMDLNFYAGSPYVRFSGTDPATRGDVQTTRSRAVNGYAYVQIEGSPRDTDLTNTLTREVEHEFTVVPYLRLVNPPSNAFQLADVISKAIFDIAEVFLGGLESPAFWIENASEYAYRTHSYAPTIKSFKVKDYEACNGVWSGDVTYEMQRHSVLIGNAAAGDVSEKIDDLAWVESDHVVATDFDYDIDNEITSSVLVSVDAGYSTRTTAHGESFKILKESDPPISCGTEELSAVGSGSSDFASQNGSIHITADGKYDISFPVIPVTVSSTYSESDTNTCPAPTNQYNEQNEANSGQVDPGIIAISGSGVVDPKDPNHIVGLSSKTETANNVTNTTKVTWDLRRACGKL